MEQPQSSKSVIEILKKLLASASLSEGFSPSGDLSVQGNKIKSGDECINLIGSDLIVYSEDTEEQKAERAEIRRLLGLLLRRQEMQDAATKEILARILFALQTQEQMLALLTTEKVKNIEDRKESEEEKVQKEAEPVAKREEETKTKKPTALSNEEMRLKEAEEVVQLAEDYNRGQNGKEKNQVKAFECASIAAKMGNVRGQYMLASCYRLGIGTLKSPQKAVEWLTKAAEQGYAMAQTELGDSYSCGYGVKQSYKVAALWYKKAAEQGNPNAQYKLALLYETGLGVTQSDEKAIELYEILSKKYVFGGSPLWDITKWEKRKKERNDGGSSSQDDNIPLQEKVAGQEDTSNQMINEEFEKVLKEGWAYLEKGNASERARAVALLHTPAIDGNALAQYLLGRCYYEGKGISRSKKKAFTWFEKSANQGYAPAQRYLGVCYLRGEGVRKDETLGSEWLGKATKQGDCDAYYLLGNYYKKIGGEYFNFSAYLYYSVAAKCGHVMAMYELGILHENGGVRYMKKDIIMAVAWYRMAAKMGSFFAKTRLKELKVE